MPSLEDRIDEITANADLDEEPDSHFEKLLGMLERVETIGVDPDAANLIDEARMEVKRSTVSLEARKSERDEQAKDDTDWTHIFTQEKEDPPPSVAPTNRSVFDDVDK